MFFCEGMGILYQEFPFFDILYLWILLKAQKFKT